MHAHQLYTPSDTHLLQLQRSGAAAEVAQEIVAARQFGVTIDLQAGKWRTADGRSGTTDPFTIIDT